MTEMMAAFTYVSSKAPEHIFITTLAVLYAFFLGKYVPSIGHYIIQAQAMADGTTASMRKLRRLPDDVKPPVFNFGGVAIGNGFTGGACHCVMWCFVRVLTDTPPHRGSRHRVLSTVPTQLHSSDQQHSCIKCSKLE